jgi:hypothetical protein
VSGAPEGEKNLSEVYAGRVEFDVREAFSDEGQVAAKTYGFGDLKHGMVGFEPDGTVAFKLPGHQFGRTEIVEKVEVMLE